MSFRVSWMVAGTMVAPILHMAEASTQYSQRRRRMDRTTSPFLMPSATKLLAMRLDRREMSVNVNSRWSPSSSIQTRAFLSGSTRAHSSTTS